MRCKKHFTVDVSSTVGVCASCLRERLSSLADAEPRAHQLGDRLVSEPKLPHQQLHPPPPPLVFPSSVSPYICRRNSDRPHAVDYLPRRNLQDIRFFGTPQVGPATTKKKKSKFHVISNLFRFRSAKSAPPSSDPFSDPGVSVSGSKMDAVSGFIYPDAGRKRSTLRLFSLNEASVFDGRRGMSPDVGKDVSDSESMSPIGFGCSPEPWKKTPSSTRASHVRARASPARSHVASGIGICLSPLMRPSPMRQWIGKSVGPGGAAEPVYSGEVRSTVKPDLSTAASLRSNRSRKLADFGKFNHNR